MPPIASPLRTRPQHNGGSRLQRLGVFGGCFVLFFISFTMILPHANHDINGNLKLQTVTLPDQTTITIQSPGHTLVQIDQQEEGAIVTIGNVKQQQQSQLLRHHNPVTSKQAFSIPKQASIISQRQNQLAIKPQRNLEIPPPPPPLEQQISGNSQVDNSAIDNDSEDNHNDNNEDINNNNEEEETDNEEENNNNETPQEEENDNDSDDNDENENETDNNNEPRTNADSTAVSIIHNPTDLSNYLVPATSLKLELESGLAITSSTHLHEFTHSLDKDAAFRGVNSFCLPWTVNGDEFWTHHPGWEMGPENATHYCFQKILNEEKAKLYKDIYHIQFHGDCSQTHTKRMWNSGWSADLTNIIDGLKHVVAARIPVQVVEKPWHYADPASAKPTPDNRQVPPACPRSNMFCYFLPVSACPPAPEGDKSQFLQDNTRRGKKGKRIHQWYYEYVTRRQTWLRKQVYEFRQKQNIHGPCTAIHCRRGDVVLHTGGLKRRYHAISEYIEAAGNSIRPNIYLMTDDANAITEAKTEFPNYNWMYIDRPRYKSNEGGWEKQIPSNNPTLEVVILLAAFQMVRQCDQLIHSRSGFATQLFAEMRETGREIDRIDLDQGNKVYSEQFKDTVSISAKYDTTANDNNKNQQAGDGDATTE